MHIEFNIDVNPVSIFTGYLILVESLAALTPVALSYKLMLHHSIIDRGAWGIDHPA